MSFHGRKANLIEERRSGIVDEEFYTRTRSAYDYNQAAMYHHDLGMQMEAIGWSDAAIAQTHRDLSEAMYHRASIEASWAAAGIEP
jgi:hypothetical protein